VDRQRDPGRGETLRRMEQRTRCTTWTLRTSVDRGRFTHNPEVAGSNPAPATMVRGPFRTRRGPLACSLFTDLCTGRPQAAPSLVPTVSSAISGTTPVPLMALTPRRGKNAAASWRSGSRMSWGRTTGRCSTRWAAGCSGCTRREAGRSNRGSRNYWATALCRQSHDRIRCVPAVGLAEATLGAMRNSCRLLVARQPRRVIHPGG
jgi:hypothetical protein